MLSDGQLAHLCHDPGLSEQARAVIAAIRAAPPSRRVRSAAGNVGVRYPSRRMGVTLQAESHRNELAGVDEKEHDPATPEYSTSRRRSRSSTRPRAGSDVMGIWRTYETGGGSVMSAPSRA
jgi:hypothetical protein